MRGTAPEHLTVPLELAALEWRQRLGWHHRDLTRHRNSWFVTPLAQRPPKSMQVRRLDMLNRGAAGATLVVAALLVVPVLGFTPHAPMQVGCGATFAPRVLLPDPQSRLCPRAQLPQTPRAH